MCGFVLAALISASAGTCTWKGGSGSWNTPANWEESAVPQDGDDVILVSGADAATIVNDIAGLSLKTLSFQGSEAKKSITLTGQGVTLTGTGLAFVSGVTVTNDVPLTVNSSCYFAVTNGFSGCLTQPIVLTGAITLKLGYYASATATVPEANYNGQFVFKSMVTGPEATVRGSTSMNAYFDAPIDVYRVHTEDWNDYRPIFRAEGNHWVTNWVAYYGSFIAQAKNALPTNMVFSWKPLYTKGNSDDRYLYTIQADQTCDRIECSEPVYQGISYELFTLAGNSGNVLTLRGTGDARCCAKLKGAFSLVWDPVGDYTQTFSGRTNTISGTLTVRGGTMAFENDVTFKSLTGLVIEDGATLRIADGSANPFTDDTVVLEVRGTGKVCVPEGMTLKLKKVTVSGVPMAAQQSYTKSTSGWIDGAGSVIASESDRVAGMTYWASPVSGAWTNADLWTDGVPDAAKKAFVTATDADYAVTVDAAVAAGETTVGNAVGTATLLVTNATGADASLTLAADKQLTVKAGGLLEMGGETSALVVGDSANGKGPIGLVVEKGGAVRTTGGTATFGVNSHGYNNTRSIFLKGGQATFTDTRVVHQTHFGAESSFYWHFGTGTLRFDGSTTSVVDNSLDTGSLTQTIYIKPDAAGDAARVEFLGNSTYAWPSSRFSVYSIFVGGEKGTATLLFDTGAALPLLASAQTVGFSAGVGELLVRRGTLKFGAYTFGIGSASSDYVATGKINVTGVVEVCEGGAIDYSGVAGANIYQQVQYSGAKAAFTVQGLMVGYGLAAQNLDSHIRGEVFLKGGQIENRFGSFLVGSGPHGDGEVVQTGGRFLTQNRAGDASAITNEVAVGCFGGTGVYRMTAGEFSTRRSVYVGGVTTNDLHRFVTNVFLFAHQFHNAKGRVSVAGGTFTTTKDIILGRDGTGVLELSSTGTVTAASITVRHTEGQDASCLRFTSDAEGRFGTIAPATRLAFESGSKLVIDATSFPPEAKRQTLLALDDAVEGLDYIKQHVEIVNAPQGAMADWSADGRRLRFGCRKGLCVIVR